MGNWISWILIIAFYGLFSIWNVAFFFDKKILDNYNKKNSMSQEERNPKKAIKEKERNNLRNYSAYAKKTFETWLTDSIMRYDYTSNNVVFSFYSLWWKLRANLPPYIGYEERYIYLLDNIISEKRVIILTEQIRIINDFIQKSTNKIKSLMTLSDEVVMKARQIISYTSAQELYNSAIQFLEDESFKLLNKSGYNQENINNYDENEKYYKTLFFKPSASIEEIKKAYMILSKMYHPDGNQSNDANKKMAEINNAYNMIKKLRNF